jgi:hypothetical protein
MISDYISLGHNIYGDDILEDYGEACTPNLDMQRMLKLCPHSLVCNGPIPWYVKGPGPLVFPHGYRR